MVSPILEEPSQPLGSESVNTDRQNLPDSPQSTEVNSEDVIQKTQEIRQESPHNEMEEADIDTPISQQQLERDRDLLLQARTQSSEDIEAEISTAPSIEPTTPLTNEAHAVSVERQSQQLEQQHANSSLSALPNTPLPTSPSPSQSPPQPNTPKILNLNSVIPGTLGNSQSIE